LATLIKKNAELERDNADYRKKIRGLKDDLATAAKSEKIPDDVAAELDAYRALGKPGDVKGRLDKAASLEREKHLAAVAEAARIDDKPVSAKVLATLAAGLDVQVRPGKAEGDAPSVVVRHKDADGRDAETPFDTFAKARWPEFLPALVSDGEPETPRPQGTPRRQAHQPAQERAAGDQKATQRQPLTRF
jgi:hypothetical protein